MMYDYIAPAEDAEAGDIGVFGVYVGASVVAGPIGNEWQIGETALIPIIDQALDGRAGSDGIGNALAKVDRNPVPGAQERCAHRTRRFALRTVHHAVDHERVFVANKTRSEARRVGKECSSRWSPYH